MNDDKYISLIHQEITGSISPADKAELDQWLSSDPDHQQVYDDMHSIWQGADHAVELDIDMAAAYQQIEKRIDSSTPIIQLQPKRNNMWMGIAAGIALVCALLYLMPRQSASTEMTTIIAQSDNMSVELPDGSTIALSAGSQVVYDPAFDKRNVSLVGSAYFDIERDERRPFVISGKRSQVRVLGTKFIYADDGDSTGYLKMISGHVELSVGDRRTQLKNLESITFDGDKLINARIKGHEWHIPTFTYQSEKVSKVIQDLRDYYQVNIDVDLGIVDCTFSGELSGSDAAEPLRVIAAVYGSSFFFDGKKYLLDGGSCQ